jgi:NAD(P)-dependent dehydrogenase (short-subunit alcohol dehydrogenase family)
MKANTSDMKGRTCLVTGANTGIGRVTATELARLGAKVVLACRNEQKATPVIEDIKSETGNQAIEFLRLDLADLASVRESANEFLTRGEPLHVLVNNAGLAGQRGLTKDGFELAFGVNHLGHFLFTNLLIDKLRESAPARIVNVSSKSHYRAKAIDWEAVRNKTSTVTGMAEYEVSKLANVLFTAELARRLDKAQVTTYSLHPGVIASDVWRKVPWPVRPLMKTFMKSTDEGAQTTLHCAASTDCADDTGLYYDECQIVKPSSASRDEDLAAELWKRSEEWTATS